MSKRATYDYFFHCSLTIEAVYIREQKMDCRNRCRSIKVGLQEMEVASDRSHRRLFEKKILYVLELNLFPFNIAFFIEMSIISFFYFITKVSKVIWNSQLFRVLRKIIFVYNYGSTVPFNFYRKNHFQKHDYD